MNKRDLWIILGVLALAGALFACARLVKQPVRSALPAQLSGITLDMDAEVRANGGDTLWQYYETVQQPLLSSLAAAGVPEAQSYMLLWLGKYFEAIPLTQALAGKTITIAQADPSAVNTAVQRF